MGELIFGRNAPRFGRVWIHRRLLPLLLFVLLAAGSAAFVMNLTTLRRVENLLRLRAENGAELFCGYLDSSGLSYNNAARIYTEKRNLEVSVLFEIVNRDGYVVADDVNGSQIGVSVGTEDITQLFHSGKTASYVGRDDVNGGRVLSVSAPVVLADGTSVGAVRYVTGLGAIRRFSLRVFAAGLGFGLLAVGFAVATGLFYLKHFCRPVSLLTEQVKNAVSEEPCFVTPTGTPDEVGDLSEALQAVTESLAEEKKLKAGLLSSVSHELRTPLTAIDGWAETLLMDAEPESVTHRGLETILSESRRLGQMVDGVLDLAKAETGRMVYNFKVFDLKQLLEETIFMMEKRLDREGMHVVYTDATEEAYVNGDKDKLKQVFVNLLDNAQKFSKPGSTIDVIIREGESAESVEIEIRDKGCGIPEDELPRVTERFFRGSSRKPGTGIGLSLCDEIIRAHNGALNIDSKPQAGTSVTVVLKEA